MYYYIIRSKTTGAYLTNSGNYSDISSHARVFLNFEDAADVALHGLEVISLQVSSTNILPSIEKDTL
jgi:hypothetical protein